MATFWENSCSFGLRYVSWYKYPIVSLVFSHLGFWSRNLFLIAPFPDLCLLVPSYVFAITRSKLMLMIKSSFDLVVIAHAHHWDTFDGHRWYCKERKAERRHVHRLSLRTGTFFAKSKMTIEEIIQFLYMWSHGLSQIKFNMNCKRHRLQIFTGLAFVGKFVKRLELNLVKKIGGQNIIVEIDESKFTKSKYNVGHRVHGG